MKNRAKPQKEDTEAFKNHEKPPNKTVKKPMKNQPDAESCSAAEAARLLGVSIPTLKRMAADGQLESFRTPGGHLRILAESIEAVREHRQQPRPLRDASPLLHNRRERLEELTLDAQELRARRELAKLRREEAEEAEQRESEAEERERQQAERLQALAVEQARIERQLAQDEQRREAERELIAFHSRWLETATELLTAKELRWLSAAERKEILDALEAEIAKRQPQDEPRMTRIVGHAVVAIVERFTAQRQARERRNRIVEDALRNLSYWATDAERAQAAAAIRESLSRLPGDAAEFEVRAAAEGAVRPLRQAVEKRLLDERLTAWAVRQSSWGSDDRDKGRVRRECAEILAELPQDVAEAEAKESLEPTIREARKEIDERHERQQRAQQKASLIREGVAEISRYLWRLKQGGEITAQEYVDSDFTANLRATVQEGLIRELSGEETAGEAIERVHEIIDAALE
ncbi:MAG TPA: helix-turn-helix domain-containing protein [Terriglobia bacterium]|nr:helix-turn-helix domain-containing protein [Terriglobia bacterium]